MAACCNTALLPLAVAGPITCSAALPSLAPCVISVGRQAGSVVVHFGRKCARQTLDSSREAHRGEGRLTVDFEGNRSRQQGGRPVLSSSSSRPVRAEAEQSNWGSDDHVHFPLSSDNGASFFDYTPRHIVRSPSHVRESSSSTLFHCDFSSFG